MKMQVYELLSALSMYSSEGYQVANTALLHYKVGACDNSMSPMVDIM